MLTLGDVLCCGHVTMTKCFCADGCLIQNCCRAELIIGMSQYLCYVSKARIEPPDFSRQH